MGFVADAALKVADGKHNTPGGLKAMWNMRLAMAALAKRIKQAQQQGSLALAGAAQGQTGSGEGSARGGAAAAGGSFKQTAAAAAAARVLSRGEAF